METIFPHAPKVMKIGKRNIFTSITSDQHSSEEEELDDVSFDFEPPPPKIGVLVKLSTHVNMSKLFLMLKASNSGFFCFRYGSISKLL